MSDNLNESNYVVHILRGGAPDKVNLGGNKYVGIKHNNCNLVNFNEGKINDIINSGEYILPSDEGDIIYMNKSNILDQSSILLPQTKDNKIIDYNSFVKKNSKVYLDLFENTGIKYCVFKLYTVEELLDLINMNYHKKSDVVFSNCAIKTTTGSGSRGVFICSTEAYNKGWFNYHKHATVNDLLKIIDFAKSECKLGHDCKIMVQDLIPIDLLKVNVDFVIRDGKLLGYKWDLPETGSNFTNWNWCDIIHTNKTDEYMNKLVDYLVNDCGVYNAIMNFEGYMNADCTELYMVEFNWRYSNSTFESLAFDIDLVHQYLINEPFEFPKGSTRICRSWTPIKESDIKNFK